MENVNDLIVNNNKIECPIILTKIPKFQFLKTHCNNINNDFISLFITKPFSALIIHGESMITN